MRRGHRLHSVHGAEPDMAGLARLPSVHRSTEEEEAREQEVWEAVQDNNVEFVEGIRSTGRDRWTWIFTQSAITEAVRLGSQEMVVALVTLFSSTSSQPYQVGEFSTIVCTSSSDTSMVLAVFDLWIAKNGFEQTTGLEVVAFAVAASARPHTSQKHFQEKRMNIVTLVETAIYVATVDKLGDVLKSLLEWMKEHKEVRSQIQMMNADCILHAALEADRDQLRILYMAGFRLGPDTTRRVNKDYLKKIKLFRARASPSYCAVAFQMSQDLETDDPMKRCLEYSLQAQHYADTIQDFNKEYEEVASKCESFAMTLLDKCTTKHEIQTLLQTKSYRGHHDANFNVAILDGHKEIVAHEKFQQLLHKKWGQRDKIHYGDDIRYNIFWSEMSKVQKLGHVIKQAVCYFLLPIVFLITSVAPSLEASSSYLHRLIIQSHIPVNRFIYYEMSKFFFLVLIFCTLVEEPASAWLAVLCVVWIFSYILEDFRTIYRLSEQGEGRAQTMRRWLTFRNILILVTNIIFLIALILRFLAHQNNQCRDGDCPYEENKMAFIGGCLWAVGALLTFLRSIQIGLMYRQIGPIIISMSYMIMDVFVFLFIFVIVYISFTLCTVYIYGVYDEDRTMFFNDHKTAFKLFYWTLIRTGNPHFPNIRSYNATLHFYNSTCLDGYIKGGASLVAAERVDECAIGKNDMVGEFDSDIEEGVPYVTGNILWAVYQFIVFIVLLSVLRARMVNTYHRIVRDADIQWKFFRASIWWKYLDHNSILPPPFTLIFLFHSAIKKFRLHCQAKRNEMDKEDRSEEKRQFNKRYKRLLLTLVASEENAWGFSQTNLSKAQAKHRASSKSMSGAAAGGGD